MNFALLGCDPLIELVVRAVARGGHRLVWADVDDAWEARLRTLLDKVETAQPSHGPPGSTRCWPGGWAELATHPQLDAVIVAASASNAEEAVSRLAQSGKHVLFAPPAGSSPIFYEELESAAQQTGRVLMPAFPLPLHPLAAWLQGQLHAERWGSLRRVHLERQVPLPADSPPGAPAGPEWFEAGAGAAESTHAPIRLPSAWWLLWGPFASDAALLHMLAGRIDRVSALAVSPLSDATGPAGAEKTAKGKRAADPLRDEPIETLSVNIIVEGGTMVGWSATATASNGHRGPQLASGGNYLTLWMEKATARMEWNRLVTGCHLSLQEGSGQTTKESGAWDAGAALAEQFLKAVDSQTLVVQSTAVAVAEAVEAAAKSLRRRRVIDVVREERTEATAFKGNMTVYGCGLLVLAFVVLVATAVGDAVGAGWMGYAWYVTITLLIGFLLLQGLGLFASQKNR